MQCVILIPAYNPDEHLLKLIDEVQEYGFTRILIVDDGSEVTCRKIFESAEFKGCRVIHHTQNFGKGEAIRTGIKEVIERRGGFVITADCDGQHSPEDIHRIAEICSQHPEAITLGVRDFCTGKVPFKSRFGNRFSSMFFKMDTGISLEDTQTGLRGIPEQLLRFALDIPGERYEYEMNFLRQAAQKGIPFVKERIHTVYENQNKGSHFRPVRDACLIYQQPLRYACASILSFVVDISFFTLFAYLMTGSEVTGIFLATIFARFISGVFNFTLNRNWSFSSKGYLPKQAALYTILFLCQMMASASICSLLSQLPIPVVVSKMITDSILFVISYMIQKRFIFVHTEKKMKQVQGGTVLR